MRLHGKKVIISFFGVLLLGIAVFTGLSMLFADEENGVLESNLRAGADPSSTSGIMTMIDWIIELSNSTEDGVDNMYHIVELDTADNESQSPLKKMLDKISSSDDDSVFEKYVLNGHKSAAQTKDFLKNHFDYKYIKCTGLVADSDAEKSVIQAISGADFIYLTEDSENQWDKDNDVTTKIKDSLYNYAVKNQKPIVVDSHSLTNKNIVSTDSKVKDVVGNEFIPKGNDYNTYKWAHDASIDEFMNPADMKYVYVPIHGDQQVDKWSSASYMIPVLDDDGNQDYEKDADGNPVVEYETNNDGSVKKDVNGEPIPVYELDNDGNKIPNLDADGNPEFIKDDNGNPIPEYEKDADGKYSEDSDGNKIPKKKLDTEGNPIPVYEKNDDGTVKIDPEGNPIPEYEKNDDGTVKTDTEGNPIPVYELEYQISYKVKYKLKYQVKDTPDYFARVLTIHNSADNDDNYLTKQIKDCCDGDYEFKDDMQLTLKDGFTKDGTILKLKTDSDLYKYGYYGRELRPTAIKFEDIDIKPSGDSNPGLEALMNIDFTKYDFIVLELSTKEIDLSKVVGSYTNFIQMMTSNTHVLYDGDISTGNSNQGSQSLSEAKNYNEFYGYIAANDNPKYPFVLITCKEDFKNYYSEANTNEAVDDIARIINSGDFRGLLGNGSGGDEKKYTVLEIEPCYPIDLYLAKALKTNAAYNINTSSGKTFAKMTGRDEIYDIYDTYYYMKPAEVSQKTPDEISYGSNDLSLTELLEPANKTQLDNLIKGIKDTNPDLDYYKWRLSPAKIAHATGKPIGDIKVIHMSSSEFAASRKEIAGSYDAIYIGGDHSAIKPGDRWYAKDKGFHYYDMYFHSGDIYDYPSNLNNNYGQQYGVLGGNDITENQLEDLIKYAENMPIILDRELCDAYREYRSKDDGQHTLDPDCNVTNLINAITSYEKGVLSAKKDDKGNVLTNVLVDFDYDYTYKAKNDNKEYGDATVKPFATVFLGGDSVPSDAYNPAEVNVQNGKVGENELKEILVSAERPLLAVYSRPYQKEYDVNDPSTWIDSSSFAADGLKWKAKLSNPTDSYSNVTYNLYIDDDSDGKFDEKNELMDSKSSLGNVTLSFKPQSDYYGVVYWKIKVTTETKFDDQGNFLNSENKVFKDKTGKILTEEDSLYMNEKEVAKTVKLECVSDGCFKIRRNKQSKMYVNFLEVMPVASEDKHSENGSNNFSRRSLFFCTECQYAKDILRGTAFDRDGIYRDKVQSGANAIHEYNNFYTSGDDVQGGYVPTTNDIESVIHKFDAKYDYKGTDLGSHTHDFGITRYENYQQYNGKVGADNIESNLFDDIREDYDVDTTILFTDEFDEKVAEIINSYKNYNAPQSERRIENYKSDYTIYKKYYDAMKAIINGKVEGYPNTYHEGTGTNISLNETNFEIDFPGFLKILADKGIGIDKVNQFVASTYYMDDALNTPSDFNMEKIDSYNRQTMIDYIKNPSINRDVRNYHHMFSISTDNNFFYNDREFGHASSDSFSKQYFVNYFYYRDAKILENFFFDEYQNALWYAAYDIDKKNVDLHKIYDCIALGAAEDFGDNDLENTTCDSLVNYINDDGNLILFHDSLNANQNATTRMTNKLSSLFGMNARHMVLGTKKVKQDKSVNILVGNTALPEAISMTSDTLTRVFEVKPQADFVDPYVHYSIGNLSETISGLTNKDKSYDITIEKAQKDVDEFNVKLYTSGTTWNEYSYTEVASLKFDASVTNVSGELWFTWGNPTSGIHNFVTSGNNNNTHIINFKINVLREDGNNHTTSAMDYNALYMVIGDDIKNPIKLTDNTNYNLASNRANSKVTKDVYSLVGAPTKSSESYADNEFGVQQFNIQIVDDSNPRKPVEGEELTYTVNDGETGSVISDSNGKAVFYRENYKAGSYKVTEDISKRESVDSSVNNGFTDEQKIKLIVYDANNKVLPNKSVTANVSSDTSFTYNTDSNGVVEFKFKNYVEQVDGTNRSYTLEKGYTNSRTYPTYFMTNLSGTANSAVSLSPWMLTYKGIFSTKDKGGPGASDKLLMYKHCSMDNKMEEPGVGNLKIGEESMRETIASGTGYPMAYPTDRTEQNNKGIITMYPFGIGDNFTISATAPVDYALDIEDDDVVVYYSLAGGMLGTASALFAADPKDGQNNYFLYQKGNITYTGAGHGSVTGYGRENNYERKLFINCIVNAGKKSAKGPSIRLYDLKDRNDGDIDMDDVKNDRANFDIVRCDYSDCDYFTEIAKESDFEGFNYIPTIMSGNIKTLKIYYNVDHTSELASKTIEPDSNDFMILNYQREKDDGTVDDSVIANELNKLTKDVTTNIVLTKDMFDPDAKDNYAYIVVELTDTSDQKVMTSLRIQYKTELLDLN
ncbi:MAG: Ig-like domain-containing protein [Eubacterium sp.]|nr:Ig-like domain-containing protein [Eubacterium sp.]